jgi:hypothetical protein
MVKAEGGGRRAEVEVCRMPPLGVTVTEPRTGILLRHQCSSQDMLHTKRRVFENVLNITYFLKTVES